MSYASYEDVILRYPICSTWAVNPTNIKSGLLDYADIELNSALSPEYSTPFSDTPPIVKDLAIDMAYYKLLIRQDIERAMAFKDFLYDRIKQLKKGEIGIVTSSGTIIEQSANKFGVWSTTQDYHPTESMLDTENPFTGIDSDYIEDLENERS